jgi:SAM-dependent methyltransferase
LALDLAAGRGIAAFALARDGWTVTAVEPDPSNIVGAGAIRSLVAETGIDVTIVEEWGERLPFEMATFDLVHCRQGLHHARDLFAMCREAARILKPGGTFIATREHVISRREDLPAFLASHALHHLYGGENAFLLEEYLRAIEGAGMKLHLVLNPFESEINFFPSNRRELRRMLARQYHWPWRSLIPNTVLRWLGRRTDAPGRLYTFAAVKLGAG